MMRDGAVDAAAVRIEAQAKAGELLRGMAERGERDVGHGDRRPESSRWQQVTAVPADTRQQYFEEMKAAAEVN